MRRAPLRRPREASALRMWSPLDRPVANFSNARAQFEIRSRPDGTGATASLLKGCP